MNIGVDIDDTISNSIETIFADSQKFDIEVAKHDGTIKKLGKIENHNYIETMYEWENEQCEQFWNKYFMKVVNEAKPKDYVVEVLRKLKEDGHNIYIITSRYEDDIFKNVIEATANWLKKNKIVYDELVTNAQNKAIVATKYNIDIFIDDSFAHCESINKIGIKAFLYTSIMNQSIENALIETEKIKRVYSWPQIYNLISNT